MSDIENKIRDESVDQIAESLQDFLKLLEDDDGYTKSMLPPIYNALDELRKRKLELAEKDAEIERLKKVEGPAVKVESAYDAARRMKKDRERRMMVGDIDYSWGFNDCYSWLLSFTPAQLEQLRKGCV